MIVRVKSRQTVRDTLAEPSIAARVRFENGQPDFIDSPNVRYWAVKGRAGLFMEVMTAPDSREVHMLVPRSEVRHGRAMAAEFIGKMFERQQVQTLTAYVLDRSMVNFCLKLGFSAHIERPSLWLMTLTRREWVAATRGHIEAAHGVHQVSFGGRCLPPRSEFG